MANVVLKADPSTAFYSVSENETEYPQTDWIWNPASWATLYNIVPTKYWKLTVGGDDVEEMNAAEKQAVDDAQAAADLAKKRAEAVSRTDFDITTRELVEALLFEINKCNTRLQELQDALVAVKGTSGGSDNIRAAIPGASPTSNPAPASFLNIQPKLRSQVLQQMVDDINAGVADP